MSHKRQVYKASELKNLCNDENSCVTVVPSTRCLALPPLFLNDMKSGIFYFLNSILKKYDRGLDGILIGYRNVKVLFDENTGIIHMGKAETEVKVSVEFYIFQPKIGNYLEGIVNKKSNTHIGCLVHKYFNATILKPEDVEYEDWICKDFNTNDKITFKIKDLDFTGLLPYIEGTIDEDLLDKCQISKKNILHFNDDTEENNVNICQSEPIQEMNNEAESCLPSNYINENTDEINSGFKKKKKKKKEKEKEKKKNDHGEEDEIHNLKDSKESNLDDSGFDQKKIDENVEKKKKKEKYNYGEECETDFVAKTDQLTKEITKKVFENYAEDTNEEESNKSDTKVKKKKKKDKHKESFVEPKILENNHESPEVKNDASFFYSTQIEPFLTSKKIEMSFCSPILRETTPTTKKKSKKEKTKDEGLFKSIINTSERVDDSSEKVDEKIEKEKNKVLKKLEKQKRRESKKAEKEKIKKDEVLMKGSSKTLVEIASNTKTKDEGQGMDIPDEKLNEESIRNKIIQEFMSKLGSPVDVSEQLNKESSEMSTKFSSETGNSKVETKTGKRINKNKDRISLSEEDKPKLQSTVSENQHVLKENSNTSLILSEPSKKKKKKSESGNSNETSEKHSLVNSRINSSEERKLEFKNVKDESNALEKLESSRILSPDTSKKKKTKVQTENLSEVDKKGNVGDIGNNVNKESSLLNSKVQTVEVSGVLSKPLLEPSPKKMTKSESKSFKDESSLLDKIKDTTEEKPKSKVQSLLDEILKNQIRQLNKECETPERKSSESDRKIKSDTKAVKKKAKEKKKSLPAGDKSNEGSNDSLYEKLLREAKVAVSLPQTPIKESDKMGKVKPRKNSVEKTPVKNIENKKDEKSLEFLTEKKSKKRKREGSDGEEISSKKFKNGSMYDVAESSPEKQLKEDKSLFTDSETNSPWKKPPELNGHLSQSDREDEKMSLKVQSLLNDLVKEEKEKLKRISEMPRGEEEVGKKSEKKKRKSKESSVKSEESLYEKLLNDAKSLISSPCDEVPKISKKKIKTSLKLPE